MSGVSVLMMHTNGVVLGTAFHSIGLVVWQVLVHFHCLVHLLYIGTAVVLVHLLLHHGVLSFSLFGVVLFIFSTVVLEVIHLLLLLKVLHVADVFGCVHLCRGHGESLLVEEGNDPLLTQHQLNHSFSFVLVEIVILVEGAGSHRVRTRAASHSASCLRWHH